MTRNPKDDRLLANHVLELLMLAGSVIGLFLGWWWGGTFYHVLGGIWCGGFGAAAIALLGYAAMQVWRASSSDPLRDSEAREGLR